MEPLRHLAHFSLLCTLAQHTAAQTPSWRWVNPPSGGEASWSTNPVYQLGSTQTVAWVTKLSPYWIYLYRQEIFEPSATRISQIWSWDESPASQFQWVINVPENELEKSPTFFLWAAQTQDDNLSPGTGWTTHYFNISNDDVSASSSAASTAMSVTTSDIPISTSTLTSTFTSAPAPSDTPDVPNSLPLKVGLGLGIPLPLLILVGILLYRKRVQSRASNELKKEDVSGHPVPSHTTEPPQLVPRQEEGETSTAELDSWPRYELG